MHGRTHGFRDIEGVAIAHDIHHLTVLGWDQNEPFMNDTFDWPQWPALDVSDNTVVNYYQGIVALGDPLGQNLDALSSPGATNPEPQTVPVSDAMLPDVKPEKTDFLTGDPLEIEVSGDASLRAEMRSRANGQRTVPQIFIDDIHIGGYDDLYLLDKKGLLDKLLAGRSE